MKRLIALAWNRWVIAACVIAAIPVATACANNANIPSYENDPFMPLGMLEQWLLNDEVILPLQPPMDSTVLPYGFELYDRGKPISSIWCNPPDDAVEVVWELRGPDTTDAILFTIFPSNKAAQDAWAKGGNAFFCQFHFSSIKTLSAERTFGNLPARLLNGATKEFVNGFSNAQVLVGNLIITSITGSSRTPFGANAHGAVHLIESAVFYLAYKACPRASYECF